MKSKQQIILSVAAIVAFAQVSNAQAIASNSDASNTTVKVATTDISVVPSTVNVAAMDNLAAASTLTTTEAPATAAPDATDNSQSMLATDGGHHGGSSSDGITGKNIIYAGVGFVGGLALIGTLYTAEGYTASSVPTISIAYERGLSAHWGVGILFNYSSVTLNASGTVDNTGDGGLPPYPYNPGQDYSYTDKYTLTGMAFGLTGAYHFTVSSDKIDPYIGAALGYTSIGNKFTSNDPNAAYGDGNYTDLAITGSGALFGGFLGIRFYFTDNIGAWADIGYLGYGGSLINVGLQAKF